MFKSIFKLPKESAERRKKQKAIFSIRKRRKKRKETIRKRENDPRHSKFTNRSFRFFEED